jgi:tetratricopeptide (TPR) repeat protein
MRFVRTEYVLKGIFLGLLFFVAMQQPSWLQTGQVAAATLAGLALCLGVAAVVKLREGFRIEGRFLPFLLFLLLESPGLVYGGILVGLAAGAYWVLPGGEDYEARLAYSVTGGALLGVVFGSLQDIENKWYRFGLNLLLASALVAGAISLFGHFGEPGSVPPLNTPDYDEAHFGIILLLGLPFFYLLTFAGREEESEVEIGAMCALMGLGFYLLKLTPAFRALVFLLPLAIFYVYTIRVLPGLRVFKHTLRGMSYSKIGRQREALLSLRRALELDPQNKLAREALWSVHRNMDLAALVRDRETLALIDLDLCLERAAGLLMRPPTPPNLAEAGRLLHLVESQRPSARCTVAYWRAVAATHAKQFDEAGRQLDEILDPARHGPDDADRLRILLPTWQLALTLKEELRQRVGQPQLQLPGRRMEAIAAVERHLAQNVDDPAGWSLKRILYQDVNEEQYRAAQIDGQPAPGFDHAYAHQLGMALVSDPVRWQRGAQYLRMAARGLPANGPTIFIQIARAEEKAGNIDAAWHNYELARNVGRAVGPKNLSPEDRQAYFGTVKMLGDSAREQGRLDAAIENYQLYSEYDRSGVDTLRTLADLYEKKGDALSALHATELALVYNGKDKDLLDRKDKYYYSVMPADLQSRLETARKGFDVDYCVRKARSLLDYPGDDLEVVDWATHLLELAALVQPASPAVKVLLARARLRRGERDEALGLFEDVFNNRPEKFASHEDEQSFYLSSRILGDMYLQELGKPDLAVKCFLTFRESSKSGADTLYKLGQAYEQLGDLAKAKKYYEHVTAYESHPMAPEAREALYRLQGSA